MVKNPPASTGDVRKVGLIAGLGRPPWRRAWQPTPVFLPGESYGQRSLAGYRSWGRKELDTTEVSLRAVACFLSFLFIFFLFLKQGVLLSPHNYVT